MLNKNYKSNTYSFYFILFTGLLKDILGEIGVSSEGSNNSNVDITIIIGKDYNK